MSEGKSDCQRWGGRGGSSHAKSCGHAKTVTLKTGTTGSQWEVLREVKWGCRWLGGESRVTQGTSEVPARMAVGQCGGSRASGFIVP